MFFFFSSFNFHTYKLTKLSMCRHDNKPGKRKKKKLSGLNPRQHFEITAMSSAKGKQAGCCSLTSADVIRVLFLGSHFNPNWQVISCLPTNNIHNALYLRNTFVLPVPLPRLVIAWLPVADEGLVPFAVVMRFARGVMHSKHKWHWVESKI